MKTFKLTYTWYIEAETKQEARLKFTNPNFDVEAIADFEEVGETIEHDPRTCENSVPCYDCAKVEGWTYGNI